MELPCGVVPITQRIVRSAGLQYFLFTGIKELEITIDKYGYRGSGAITREGDVL